MDFDAFFRMIADRQAASDRAGYRGPDDDAEYARHDRRASAADQKNQQDRELGA